MWYLLLFVLLDVASAYVSSTLVGSVEDHLCNGGIWDVTKMEYVVNGGNTLYTSQQCADYCSNWIYTRGSYNPGDTIRHYATNRVGGTDRKCFCHYPEFTTNNHCEIQSNQDGNTYYDILYIDTAVICTEGEICTLVQATIQDNVHNNIHTEQNPMALNTGSPSYIFGGVQGGWFKMVRTNGEGVMQETRYIGPHNSPSVTDIAGLDISKWNDAASTSNTDVEGKTTCVTNRYCVQDFEWSACTASTSPLSAPCSYGEECTGGDVTYTLNMFDSYGDGWHGGSLSVDYGDGLKSYTVSGSSSTVTFTGTITVMYMDFETWANEISWTLTVNGVSKTWNGFPSSMNANTYTVDLSEVPGDQTVGQTCTSQTCPAGKAYFDGECMLPCLIPTTQYYHAYGQTMIRPYQGDGLDNNPAGFYPTTKDELTKMCLDACTGVTQVPDTYTGEYGGGNWASVSPFTPADYAKFNVFEVKDNPSNIQRGRCYCHTYTPESALAAGITPINGNTASYSYYILDKTSEGCVPAPTAPPCVSELALLEEDCSYSGGTCPKGYIYLGNNECRPESDIRCGAGKYIDATFSCINCQAGRFSATGGLSCEDCEIGSYQDQVGQPSCKVCTGAQEKGMTTCSCETGQYVAMGTVTGIAESNTLYCPDGESYSSAMRMWYSNEDWGGDPDRLNFAAGLGGWNQAEEGAYLNTYGTTPGQEAPVTHYQTCYAKCKDVEGVRRIAAADYGRGYYQSRYYWKVYCYCLTNDGSGCTVDNALTQLSSYDSRGTGNVKVFDLLAESTCEDCPAGSYQDQEGISTCKSCPSGFYQDQSGQISCESCSVGYIPNAGKTDCSYCAAEDTNFNDDWVTGCGPWASVDGCSCVCGDSGFTGDHCHECGEGKGWNATSQTCDACEYPFINDQDTHDAECSHAYCPPGQGTTKDVNTWKADNSSNICVPCEGITVSPRYYGQCADISCDGQTVPKSVIDHTLSTIDQANCEECPSDKVKNGIQCVIPVCINGYPKDNIDQTYTHDDSRNCYTCGDHESQHGLTCIPNTCSAGTGLVMKDLPQFSAFAVKGDLVAGVEGITLVVVNEEGHRVSVQPHDHKSILDLAWVGEKIAVVMSGDWVRLYNVTIDPLAIEESGIIYDSFTHIDVDSFDYIYLGKTSWLPGKKYSAALSAIDLPVYGGHVSAGGGSVAGCASGSIQFHRDGTTKSFSVPGCSLVDVNQFGTHVAFKTTTGDVYIWNIENAEPVSIDIESSALVWVYDTLYFGNSGGVYSISAPYNQVPTEAYIPDVSVTHLDVVGENTMELIITGESVRVKLFCLPCEGLTSNDGFGLFCKDIWCSSDKNPKETIDHTLAFNSNDNCEQCSGLNSGVPCLPIECPDGYVVNPVDNTYDYDDIRNCAPCLSTQVSVGTKCQDIICPLGQKINRVGAGYSPRDDRNCEVCPDFHVGDGKVCTAGFCSLRAFSGSFDQTIDFDDIANCGDTCSGSTIKDGSQCSACTGETIPDATRENCIPVTCPIGYEHDFISNNVTYVNGELLNPLQNCADIDDCIGVSCAECVDLINGYYCKSDIRMGDTLETFSRENVELCPEGFRLTWNSLESGKDLGNFECPPFVSYREKIEYDGINVKSIMFDGTCSNSTFTRESTCLEDVEGCSDQSFTSQSTCLEERGVWTAKCSSGFHYVAWKCTDYPVNTWSYNYDSNVYACTGPQGNYLSQFTSEGDCLGEKHVWTEECSISGIDNEADCITPTNTWDETPVNTWTRLVNTATYHGTKCEYNYKYISKNDEPFYTADGGGDAVTSDGKIYLYCPIKCSRDEPCGVGHCVAGTCVDHDCTDNAQASGCLCYGGTCNKWCMDNGECVDIVGESVSNDINAVISAYNNIE